MSESSRGLARVGLRLNPYCNLDHAELVDRIPTPQWVQSLADEQWDVLALHGPSGLGKSTAAHLIARESGLRWTYHRLDERRPRWPNWPDRSELLVVDCVQRLGRMRRNRGRRLLGLGRLVLCGHVDVTQAWRGEIRRVTPPPPTSAEVRDVHEALTAAQSVDGSGWSLDHAVIDALLASAGSSRYRLHRVQYLAFELLAREPNPMGSLSLDQVARAAELLSSEVPF